jgi:hypothetical protein
MSSRNDSSYSKNTSAKFIILIIALLIPSLKFTELDEILADVILQCGQRAFIGKVISHL